MLSLWSDNVELPQFKSLEGDLKADVLIVGGGLAGLLTAYFLRQEGIDYALVEGRSIASGVTANTTAKITVQHGLIYHRLLRQFGLEQAQAYLGYHYKALKKFQELCQSIDCDFEEKDAYVYTLSDRRIIEKEIAAIQKLGFAADLSDTLPLPFPTSGAVHFPGQAQFNPLAFIKSIAPGLNIYENTWVNDIIGHTALTEKGNIRAEKIILTTHFPFLRAGTYFLRMYQDRSYVLALENGQDVGGMYVDAAEKGMSFRNYRDNLLIGGGDHRTGKKGGNWTELEQFVQKYYPQQWISHRWATQDCMTLDGIPYIGSFSKGKPQLYVATGFQKWGMTSSMVSAMILTDMIMGREEKNAAIFSPARSLWHPQLVINGWEAAVNLLTPSQKRCPHMGCALKRNTAEHTWDCACHGSRFSRTGELLESPANKHLKNKN